MTGDFSHIDPTRIATDPDAPAGRAARGFTLIEMLVSIAIIVLMIAMLLPALRKARGVADQVKCGSNMRQVYIAIAAYNASNRDELGLKPHGPNAEPIAWVRRIITYLGDDGRGYDWSINTTWCATDAASQASTVYRHNKVLVCPSNDFVHPGVPWGYYIDTYWGSYAANLQGWWNARGPGEHESLWNWETQPPLAGVWSRHKPFGTTNYAIIMEGTSAQNTGDFQWGYFFSNQHLSMPTWGPVFGPLFHEMHNHINNFLIDDGHVASRKFDVDPAGFWPTVNALTPVLENPTW